MLATLIPLFDENISVKAYSLFSQKKNLFLNPSLAGTGYNDGAGNINGLDIIDSIGINNLVSGADVFVPVTDISLFTGIENLCKAPAERIVLLIDNSVKPEEQFIKRIKDLRSKGYKFAIRKLTIADFEPYRQILLLMDYILLNHRKLVIGNAKIYFSKMYPNIKLVACGVDTMDDFKMLKKSGGYSFYEGDFYRLPITKGAKEVSPLKTNYIELLNIVNGPDFDLTDAADVIGRDTALVISLLEIVNRIAVNSEITSIRHAAAMLGQKELKKWITTAITQQLCSDRPSEIMRLSLLRAKFAENISGQFELGVFGPELFLMGLFSVVDIILNKPMEEALALLKVSKNISRALVSHDGPFVDVLDFIQVYEAGDWQEVSRILLINDMSMDAVYEAYLGSLEWYRDLFHSIEES